MPAPDPFIRDLISDRSCSVTCQSSSHATCSMECIQCSVKLPEASCSATAPMARHAVKPAPVAE